jgi:2,3-bisphosphoglycerate-dependent phosphoglycerate mutase
VQSATELWLVRHGETTANASGELSGWTDVGLTARGEAQARALFPALSNEHFDSIWSSDLKRAIATAKLACGVSDAELRRDARIREMHFGEIEARRWDDVAADLRDGLLGFIAFDAPGGEGLAQFKARVRGFADALPPGRHLVFTHGGVIRALTMDLGEDRFVGNGALCALSWSERRILFVRERAC